MRPRVCPHPRLDPPGFTMIEVVIVVGIIVLAAAVALPNIAGYLRHAKVRGATQQVAGEIQTARNKAIVKNVNPAPNPLGGGVIFTVLDANTYRFTVIDDNLAETPPNPRLGVAPLRDLPQGLRFVPATVGPTTAIGFNQLGSQCLLGQTNCAQLPTLALTCPDADPRCADNNPGAYINFDVATRLATIQIRDDATQVMRWVQVVGGGKVMSQR